MTDGLHISVVSSSLGVVFFSTMKYQQYINNIMAARSAATTLCTAHVYNKGEKPGIGQFLRGSLLWLTNDRDANVRKWRQFVLVYCGQKNVNKIMPDFEQN